MSPNDTTISIPLTKGYTAIVDECDGDLLMFKWYAMLSHKIRPYGARWNREKSRTPIMLHKVIFERKIGRCLSDNELVDHIDNNSMNNQRNNLRLASRITNGQNRKLNQNTTSGFKGVNWREKRKTWVARITVNKKTIYLGSFKSAEEAYRAYCKAAQEYFGEFARFE